MPRLIVLAGLPASGKSTIARELARRTGAIWLRIDSMDQAIWSSPTAPRDLENWTYLAAQAVATDNLRLGRDVIADCVNDSWEARKGWRLAGERAGAIPHWLQIVCGDPVEHRRRLESRASDVPHLALDGEAVRARSYAAWDRPGATINTAAATLQDCVATAMKALETETARDRSRAAPL